MIRLVVSVPLFLLSGALMPSAAAALSAPVDSIGTERREGRVYVLHRVEDGQTLYSLLRKYRVTMAEFQAANPGVGEAVRFEQVVRMPYYGPITAPAPAATASTAPPEAPPLPGTPEVRPSTYTVQAGETLYSIARRFGVGVNDLITWNQLPETGTVQTGQTLRLTPGPEVPPRKPAEAPQPPARQPEPQPTEARPAEPARRPAAEAPQPDARRSADGPVPNASTGTRRHTETGLAELIEVPSRSGKYLALHRTAPVGTVLTVRNEATNQTVLVKVIGKLPDTGSSDRVIVRLSPRAFAQVAPSDKRFPAEVTYLTD